MVSPSLTCSLENKAVFYDRVLLSLWSLLTRKKISMNMILLKYVLCVCIDPLRTPHNRTKKEKEKQKPISKAVFFFFSQIDWRHRLF